MKIYDIYIREKEKYIYVYIYDLNKYEDEDYIKAHHKFNKRGRDPIERILMFIKENIEDLKEWM